MTTTDIEAADPREAAIARIKARRDFFRHLAVFVIINAALIGIWASSGAGYFWPAWVLIGWGMGLLFHAWDVFGHPITEDDIRREMNRRSHA